MRRAGDWGLAALAALMTGAFVAAVTGGGGFGPGEQGPGRTETAYFHAGKTRPGSFGGRDCLSRECHAGAPHAGGGAAAAFRNMHAGFVDCLVCHGKQPGGAWTAAAPAPPEGGGGRVDGASRGRWRIAVRAAGIDRRRMHELTGPALKCRACHSEEGYRRMAGLGIRDLARGFADPVALRMIEEGAKQWMPDALR